jgi:VanZ family protein
MSIGCYVYRVLDQYHIAPSSTLISNDGVHSLCSLGLFGLINSRANSPYTSAVATLAAGGAWELYQQIFMRGAEVRDLVMNTIGVTVGVGIAKYLEHASEDLEERLLLP